MNSLKVLSLNEITPLVSKRSGENKLGEIVEFLTSPLNFNTALNNSTAKFVLLGIPEDIGVAANFGQRGAANMWSAFLGKWLNIQSNTFNDGSLIFVAGEVNADAEMQAASNLDPNNATDLATLRKLTGLIDQKVNEIILGILNCGKIPVIIGGGHNNSYPLLRALSEYKNQAVNCLNIDPHADLRALEGRHSGNGFSYAIAERYLEKYFVFGLHQNYNSSFILEQFKQPNLSYFLFEDYLKNPETVHDHFQEALNFVASNTFGLEIDLDAVAGFPSSARSETGWTVNNVRRLIMQAAKRKPAYIHFSEGAPDKQNPNDTSAKTLAYFVSDFLKSYPLT